MQYISSSLKQSKADLEVANCPASEILHIKDVEEATIEQKCAGSLWRKPLLLMTYKDVGSLSITF